MLLKLSSTNFSAALASDGQKLIIIPDVNIGIPAMNYGPESVIRSELFSNDCQSLIVSLISGEKEFPGVKFTRLFPQMAHKVDMISVQTLMMLLWLETVLLI